MLEFLDVYILLYINYIVMKFLILGTLKERLEGIQRKITRN